MLKPEDIIDFRKDRDVYMQQYWGKRHPEEKAKRELENQLREYQRSQGKIYNHSVKKWLDNEITAARVGLIITMALTALIKGQIVIWIILYIAYRLRVKKAKQDAIEADKRSDLR